MVAGGASALDRRIGALVAGKYQLVRRIGSGAMGIVYEARHVDLGRRVAVKLIPNDTLVAGGDLARRFRREARAAAAIESDHVVQVFDSGHDPELGLYMVMELLVGEDLEARLRRERALDPRLAVRIAEQVGSALAKAHQAGVVHRDLKPANVFLTTREDGSLFVKVLDFGVAKLLGEAKLAATGSQEPLTRYGSLIGTLEYMSPEQAAGQSDVDHRADVWALGVLLYEMIAGSPPYPEARTLAEALLQILKTEPLPLGSIAPWAPPPIVTLVGEALRRDRAARIADCATFVARLREIAPALHAAAEDESEPTEMWASGPEVEAVGAKPTRDIAFSETLPVDSSAPVSAPADARADDADAGEEKAEFFRVDDVRRSFPSLTDVAKPPPLPPVAAPRSRGWLVAAVAVVALCLGIAALALCAR